MTAAEISGGSNPWQNASPQPVMPSFVFISTRVADLLFTQPWEKEKDVSKWDWITWIFNYVILLLIIIKYYNFLFTTT